MIYPLSSEKITDVERDCYGGSASITCTYMFPVSTRLARVSKKSSSTNTTTAISPWKIEDMVSVLIPPIFYLKRISLACIFPDH